MKKLISGLSILVCASTFASAETNSLNSKEFLDCFIKAANESIVEIKESDDKNSKVRICDELSQDLINKYTSKFTFIDGGKLYYYSAESMGQEKLIDLYDYMKDEMNCYAPKVSNGGLIPDIINSRTYYRNMELTQMALEKIGGVELWDKFFSPSGYKRLNELDLSYCQGE
jgi:hypothetical protein